MLTDSDFDALWLSIKLASIVTIILLLIGTPIAWWLARTTSRLRIIISSIVSIPIVLPPTVIGFYFLLAMSPEGVIGVISESLGIKPLAFTFTGLVVASTFYSLPFMVQPLQNAFINVGNRPLEIAATLRASPIDTFLNVILPITKVGYISAIILTFTHTIGEFGVVLMIGGNIPEVTRVVSVQIYDYVETFEYANAHRLSLIMLGFTFITLIILFILQIKPLPRKGANLV